MYIYILPRRNVYIFFRETLNALFKGVATQQETLKHFQAKIQLFVSLFVQLKEKVQETRLSHHRPLNSKMKCSEEHVWYCCLIVPCPSRGISTLNHCVRVHITSQGVCCFRLQTFSRLYLLGNPQPAFFLKVWEGCTGEAPFFRATCATLQLLLLTMCICCCAA